MKGEAATLAVVSPEAEPDEPEEVEEASEPEPPSKDHEARRANGNMMARWSQETRAMLVMEFIAASNLYAELNAYLKKQIR